MNCTYKLNIKFLIIGFFTLSDVGVVNAKDDSQYWNELILKHAATQKLDFHIISNREIISSLFLERWMLVTREQFVFGTDVPVKISHS